MLGGCVQDFVILGYSLKRDGRSLGKMASEEIGPVGGFTALIGVLMIMVILIAVLGLVVVNAMKHSIWATSTVAATVPIAMLVGIYMTHLRPGRVVEGSMLGVALILLAVWGGRYRRGLQLRHATSSWTRRIWRCGSSRYGFLASVLPIWLLLAPRDYLSAFIKIGTIVALAIGIVALHPHALMPPLTQFIDGSGPVFGGKVFPFAFITVACGAISGFHSLIASGTTPKMLMREGDARMVGYGAHDDGIIRRDHGDDRGGDARARRLLRDQQPGRRGGHRRRRMRKDFVVGIPGHRRRKCSSSPRRWARPRCYARTGGAPSLAVGMAHIFAHSLGGQAVMATLVPLRDHVRGAVHPEHARCGHARRALHAAGPARHIYTRRSATARSYPNIVVTSLMVVAAWGYFLYFGTIDPLGGINSLWPLFGIANQMLATIALCVATSAMIRSGKARYALVTLLPLIWLVAVTMTAGVEKIFSAMPNVGFLAARREARGERRPRRRRTARARVEIARLIWNDRIDAAMTAFFIAVVVIILADSARIWTKLVLGSGRGTRTQQAAA